MSDDDQTTDSALELTKRETMGRVVDCVAHDINNLLTAVLSFARFALKSLPEDSQASQDITEIFDAAQRATVLTRSLTALMRKRGGAPCPVPLNDLVTGLHRLMRRLIPEDIELATVPATGEVHVISDPDRLWCLLAELLLVLRQSVGSGGKMTVTVVETVASGTSPAGIRLELLGAPAAGVQLGTIELAPACHTLASEARCELTHRATGDEGPTFRLELRPASAEETARYWPADLRSDGGGQGGDHRSRREVTILVVEDEPAILAVTVRILEEAGYRTLRASDGSQALRVSETHDGPIDLLLSDVVMPQLNGPELAERLARSRPEMRIAFMTGYSPEAVWRGSTGLREAPVLPKPFSEEELLAAVGRLLGAD